jgi:hypothetical protein
MAKSSSSKVTSKSVASEASKIMGDKRYSAASRSVAASALAQATGKK